MMKSPILSKAGIISIGLPLLLLLGGCTSDEAKVNEPNEVHEDSGKKADVEKAPASDKEEKPKEKAPDNEKAKGVENSTTPSKPAMKDSTAAAKGDKEVITLGGGCFWCTEAVLEQLEGIDDVVSGYMGGHVENPTYEQVCGARTGHAEVIQVTFDPSVITLNDILDIFWQAHDPTTLNRQGNDRGPQYRSAIFYHSPEQKNIAEQSKAKLDASGKYSDPAVTEITKASKFWVAEDYHQDYYQNNKDKNPYCPIVITPKLRKLGLEE